MRDRSDEILKTKGARQRLLAKLGTNLPSSPRGDICQELFERGSRRSKGGLPPAALSQSLKASGVALAVCALDKVYARAGSRRRKGPSRRRRKNIYMAGAPSDQKRPFAAAGVNDSSLPAVTRWPRCRRLSAGGANMDGAKPLLTAASNCGAIRLRAVGAGQGRQRCHCRMCQKDSARRSLPLPISKKTEFHLDRASGRVSILLDRRARFCRDADPAQLPQHRRYDRDPDRHLRTADRVVADQQFGTEFPARWVVAIGKPAEPKPRCRIWCGRAWGIVTPASVTMIRCGIIAWHT